MSDTFHTGKNFYPLRKFSPFVSDELLRRRKNRGLSTPQTTPAEYDGPMNAWCRVTSLAKVQFKNGQNSVEKFGFTMYNNLGFEKIYGFEQDGGSSVLGYDLSNSPHRISDINGNISNIHRPSPGVTGFDTEMMNAEGKFRTMNLKFRCHDKYQLEYLTPYFMTPGISIVVEWGWSNFNKWYYGVRYSKNCNPSEFWVTYFTSSKYVNDFGIPPAIVVCLLYCSFRF